MAVTFAVDFSGQILVHGCDTPEHQILCLWNDHSNEWKQRHKGQAISQINALAHAAHRDLGGPSGSSTSLQVALASLRGAP
jgi:hypothetical protein